jgi:hypothetical protein
VSETGTDPGNLESGASEDPIMTATEITLLGEDTKVTEKAELRSFTVDTCVEW